MDKLTIKKARLEQTDEIYEIVSKTIKEIYSKYYSNEVVDFLLELHNRDNIKSDISKDNTYVIGCDDTILGTGTMNRNVISRVFITPNNQHKEIGSKLMDYLENEIIKNYSCVNIDAPLPATEFYRERGYELLRQAEHSVANGKLLSYSIMRKREFKIDPALYNAPSVLVRKEIELQGLDFDEYQKKVPNRVYLLADSLFDSMLAKNVGTLTFDVCGGIYVMNHNSNLGFAKGEMCSPGLATQAEDLYAAGVKELIHVGFAGGNKIGEYVLTDGAYNDTSITRLYGFKGELIESTKDLTDSFCMELEQKGVSCIRGYHWTTDGGYVQPEWRGRYYLNDLGAKCVEMEGAGLFTIANFRSRKATAIYIVSDSGSNDEWTLGWGESILENSIQKLIDAL
ncbi:MAG: GNAT family N-acetyltransferase, partial [Clostridiales bacterium]|nr:GNAT family N-acetyltransferase [Clostridiales bacterium]